MADNLRPFVPGNWEAVNRIYKQGIDTNLATFQTSCPAYEEWDSTHLSCIYIGRACRRVGGSLAGIKSLCV